ncbi:MAG: HisA/HisF-related TIM barrel protein [Chloroflexota bacterium]|nr:HisA/HisF-related TIM barrel protein [Chloroflexota bacterium]
MELICAIDLLDGGAVRLVQGDYRRRVAAGTDAAGLARRFVAAGCRRLHVVDLAGARAGRPMQLDLVGKVVTSARSMAPGVVVEAGGGLRRPADVDRVLERADEALLGTSAIEDADFLRTCAADHPGRIVVSLDLRDGRPALDGWLRMGSADASELAQRLVDDGASRLVVTDTARDGTLAGPNLALLGRLRAAVPQAVLVAAGGIGSIDDLRQVREVGCDGAVVGLALLTGAIDPAEAMAVLA